jgi:hypothetical protein
MNQGVFQISVKNKFIGIYCFIYLYSKKKEGEILAKFVENRTKIKLLVGQIKHGRIRAKTMA